VCEHGNVEGAGMGPGASRAEERGQGCEAGGGTWRGGTDGGVSRGGEERWGCETWRGGTDGGVSCGGEERWGCDVDSWWRVKA
jgi:hypothetical protein